MNRIILKFLNPPILIIITLLCVVIQTSLFQSWPLLYLQPDFILLAVVWCALKRNFEEGGIITLIVANIAEVHSAAPAGLFLTTYMLVYLGIRGASQIIVIPGRLSIVMVTMFSSIVWKLEGLWILHFLGAAGNQWKHTVTLLFPGAVIEGVVSIWFFRALEKFDWMTYKNARAEKLSEGEMDLEGELI
jgi:hypothetical protein